MWPRQDDSAAFVFEAVALACDLHDGRVMQDAVEHGGRQHGIGCEGFVAAAERQVRGQDQRTFFIAACDNLKEQVGLLAPQGR